MSHKDVVINKVTDTGSNTNDVEVFYNRKKFTVTMNDTDLAALQDALAEPEPEADINDAITAAKAADDTASLTSPAFTGTPTAPTAAADTSTTQLATTAFATTADNLRANKASPVFTGTVGIPAYAFASLPAVVVNAIIIVTDADGGASGSGTICFGKGSSWIDVSTGLAVAKA